MENAICRNKINVFTQPYNSLVTKNSLCKTNDNSLIATQLINARRVKRCAIKCSKNIKLSKRYLTTEHCRLNHLSAHIY